MRTFALTLREYLPHAVPVAVHEGRGVVVAAVASAWGFWSGLDAEVPAVKAAIETLIEVTAHARPDWDAALETAFSSAARRLDSLPGAKDGDDLDLVPGTSLACAVVTRQGVTVGWTGGIVACIVRRNQILRSTEPHTWFNKLKNEEAVPSAELVGVASPLRNIIARSVEPTHRPQHSPEIERWPPLEIGDRLLLADRRRVAVVRRALPLVATTGDAWLREALSSPANMRDDDTRGERGDRVGVLVEP